MTENSGKKDPSSLAGRLLLAMPAMGDPRFHKAVIFMCAHDKGGAMGLVINHAVPGLTLQQLLQQLNIASGEQIKIPADKMPVLSGGPVESARGFVLHSTDFMQPDTVRIDDRFGVTGTIDALKAIAAGTGPQNMLFVLGYAGWSPGQLDREIQDNAWLVADADPVFIFGAGATEKWDKAVRGLGVDPAMLSGAAGRA